MHPAPCPTSADTPTKVFLISYISWENLGKSHNKGNPGSTPDHSVVESPMHSETGSERQLQINLQCRFWW